MRCGQFGERRQIHLRRLRGRGRGGHAGHGQQGVEGFGGTVAAGHGLDGVPAELARLGAVVRGQQGRGGVQARAFGQGRGGEQTAGERGGLGEMVAAHGQLHAQLPIRGRARRARGPHLTQTLLGGVEVADAEFGGGISRAGPRR